MRTKIDLNGPWSFAERGSDDWLQGTVPGTVATDLLACGRIDDPFYGLNETQVQALENKEWVYRRTFRFEEDPARFDLIALVCEGLDTFAELYLNGQFLGKSENMLIPYRFDAKSAIRQGENALEVRFASTMRVARALLNASAANLGHCCEPAFSYIRKGHYTSGWDWSPRLITAGIWRPVYLECVAEARLVDPYCHTLLLDAGQAVVRVEGQVEAAGDAAYQADIQITLRGEVVAQAAVPIAPGPTGPGFEAQLTIADPQRWWPNGWGEATLYDVTVRLLAGETPLDERHFRTGLRSIKLLREKDAEGESFVFVVNGQKVFAKGANWIPGDNFLPRMTPLKYRAYIEMARDANMNMLMEWGGGIYEDPSFYEACDECGIMVWQTFMWHFLEVPAWTEWYQKLAKQEVETAVRQLRNHACIVLWCGECENAWAFPSADKYRGAYLYTDLFPEICARLDPSRPYWPGSPYGGRDPNGMSEGDRHAYGVYLQWQDVTAYSKDTGRFLSEFGVQAMSTWKTLQAYCPPEERHLLSPTIVSHNKLPDGMETITRYMVDLLGFPKDLQSFHYLSQFNQAEMVKLAIEHWRGRKFLTGGTLYWMLNDCWPAGSFGSIDYFQRRKALYYYARALYAPLLPIICDEEGGIAIQLVNDSLREMPATVRVAAYRMDGTPQAQVTFEATVAPNGNEIVKRLSYDDLGIGYEPRSLPEDSRYTLNVKIRNGALLDTVVYVDVEAEGRHYRNYHVFARFRDLRVEEPELHWDIYHQAVTIRADRPAFAVFLEPERDVQFSNNCLVLEPNVDYKVLASGEPGDVMAYSLWEMLNKLF